MLFVPKGSISLPDVVEIVVARCHGQDAIAAYEGMGHSGKETTFETRKGSGKFGQQRPMYVVRAGKKILFTKEAERWDGAKNQIQAALSKDQLTARTTTESGKEYDVPKEYWHGEDAWRVFETGNLENPESSELAGRPVYLDRASAMGWVETLPGHEASPPDSSLQKMQDERVKPDTQKKYIEWWAAAQEIRGNKSIDSEALAGKVAARVDAKLGTIHRTLNRFFPGWSG